MDALASSLAEMTVNKERMAQCANDHWSQASTVVGYLVKEHGMSYRTGHQILSLMMQEVADKNIPPSQVKARVLEDAIEKYTGKKIAVGQDVLDRLFDAMNCVRERKYRGGAAPERVADHIAAARENLAHDRKIAMRLAERIDAAKTRLDSAFCALQRKHAK